MATRLGYCTMLVQRCEAHVTMIDCPTPGTNLNVHYHLVIADGVFVPDAITGALSVLQMPAPTDADLLAILDRVADRIADRLADGRRGDIWSVTTVCSDPRRVTARSLVAWCRRPTPPRPGVAIRRSPW